MAISPVRLSVKTTIPSKSSGRLLDALTDIIRPFTERRGLKADILHLQREEMAYRVAVLAAKRIQLENRPITPVPLKALVPLLEHASLEDAGDTTMIEMWANLLASAAMGAQNNVPRYVSILSEINGRQARIIQNIMTMGGKTRGKLHGELLLDELWSVDEAGVMLKLKQEVLKATPAKIASVIKKHVNCYGVALSDVIIGKGEDQWDFNRGFFPLDKNRVDIETLESLNLLKDATFKNVLFQEYDVSVFLYRVTPMCIDMFAACNPDLLERRDVPTPGEAALKKSSKEKRARASAATRRSQSRFQDEFRE